MADPVTILAIVEALASTASFCCHIIRRVVDAPKEIWDLNGEASNWRPQLEDLAELLENDSESAGRFRKKLEDGGLIEVKSIVDELNHVLEQFQSTSLRKKLKWSLSAGDQVRELLAQLRRGMEVIINGLQVEHLIILDRIGKEVREIRKIQTFQTNEHERRNILQWLKPQGVDCHEFHQDRKALRERGTCDWLANSSAWIDWCEGGSAKNARFLWIHGLPGAGKTVLASFAIDHVINKYQHVGVSYYYCSHERHKKGHTSSEETCSFLRWVIRDLTAQVTRPMVRNSNHQATIPKTLENLYVEHDFSIEKLLDCLLAVTQYITTESQQQVCIIVDAVDECPSPRDALLNVLTTIGTDPDWQHVSLCFTSRKEADIARAISAIQPSQPPTPAMPQRLILVPKGPKDQLQRRGRPAGVARAGFDGGSPSHDEMPPPPLPGSGNTRGRPPSGGFSHSSPFRVSRSVDSGLQSGGTTFHGGGRERPLLPDPSADSRITDPMEIDSPGHTIPRAQKRGCTILSMDDNPDVMEAIRTFVRTQLQDHDMFQRSHPRDVDEVIELIAKKAKGIWAACQVDIIIRSNLRDRVSISEMLERIPPDIFGTYEHMIMRLLPNGQGENEHNRNFARTALALICSESSGVSCAEVLVEASRFNVPHGNADNFNLAQLEKILGCLITVRSLPRRPESMYSRNADGAGAKKQVSLAHYTVKEYLFDKATELGPVKEFALSREAIQRLELEVIFSGLRQFGTNRPVEARYPTRYEEYCLKMTDKALKNRRDLIIQDKKLWKTVTWCLRWNSNHNQTKSGAFPNMKTRAAFPRLTKTSPFDQGKEPKIPETSVLVSLLLLQWPELAKVFLADLPESTKREVWRDDFELARGFKVDGTNPTSLMQLCVTRRDMTFLQALIDSRADFSGETDLVMDLFYHAYGDRSLDDEDGGAKTGQMLKMLLERGVQPEAPGYVFTPLQFAVSNLEDRWVSDLLSEWANPNAVGSKGGVHPFGAGHDDVDGQMTPLAICKVTKPEWLKSDLDADLMEDARDRVQCLLRQWGAVDQPIVVSDDEEEME